MLEYVQPHAVIPKCCRFDRGGVRFVPTPPREGRRTPCVQLSRLVNDNHCHCLLFLIPKTVLKGCRTCTINRMATLGYIGSKHSLMDAIDEVIEKNLPDIAQCTVVDLFAGTVAVGTHLNRKHGCVVIANDCELYASLIATALLKCPFTDRLACHLDTINSLPPQDGPLAYELSEKRMFFTMENGKKLQAARSYVDKVPMSDTERAFLIASIITSCDRVANTASVYASYLKQYKKRALTKLTVLPIHMDLIIPNVELNEVHNCNANELVRMGRIGSNNKTMVFLDPPYVSRNYSSYYSPFNVIASNNTNDLRGVGALMPGNYMSDYSAKRKVDGAFKELVENLKSKVEHIFMTYSSTGLMQETNIDAVLSSFGSVHKYDVSNRKFKSKSTAETSDVTEKWYFVTDNVAE